MCSQTLYFSQHGCTTKEAQAKYNSRAASLYREKLSGLSAAAHKKYNMQVCYKYVCSVCRSFWFGSSLVFVE